MINVEAVTANHRDNLNDSFYTEQSRQDRINLSQQEFIDQSSIKLVGKIKDKQDIFTGKNGKKHPYASLEHVKDNPFVIAISPFDHHLSQQQNNIAINRVLYGVEPPSSLDGTIERIDYLTNPNGSKIEMGLFTSDAFKHVSAVIFSTTATLSKALLQSEISGEVQATRYREFSPKPGSVYPPMELKKLSESHSVSQIRFLIEGTVFGKDEHFCKASEYEETHLDGLHIYYNPYAEIPLDRSLFSAKEITHNLMDFDTNEFVCQHNDGALVSRQFFVIDDMQIKG